MTQSYARDRHPSRLVCYTTAHARFGYVMQSLLTLQLCKAALSERIGVVSRVIVAGFLDAIVY